MTPARKQLNQLIPEFAKNFTEKDKVLFVGVDKVWDYRSFFKCEYNTLDINPNTNPDIVADIQGCPAILSSTYNGIIMTGVYEYLQNKKATMAEIWRILKEGGFCLVCFPALAYYPKREKHFNFSNLDLFSNFLIEKIHFTYYKGRPYYYHFFIRKRLRL